MTRALRVAVASLAISLASCAPKATLSTASPVPSVAPPAKIESPPEAPARVVEFKQTDGYKAFVFEYPDSNISAPPVHPGEKLQEHFVRCVEDIDKHHVSCNVATPSSRVCEANQISCDWLRKSFELERTSPSQSIASAVATSWGKWDGSPALTKAVVHVQVEQTWLQRAMRPVPCEQPMFDHPGPCMAAVGPFRRVHHDNISFILLGGYQATDPRGLLHALGVGYKLVTLPLLKPKPDSDFAGDAFEAVQTFTPKAVHEALDKLNALTEPDLRIAYAFDAIAIAAAMGEPEVAKEAYQNLQYELRARRGELPPAIADALAAAKPTFERIARGDLLVRPPFDVPYNATMPGL